MVNDKLFYTILTTLVFILFNNPFTYKMLDKMLGHVIKISSFDGCPTVNGLIVATLLFALAIFLLMVFSDVVDSLKYKIRSLLGMSNESDVSASIPTVNTPAQDSNTTIPEVVLPEDKIAVTTSETTTEIPKTSDAESINVKEGFSPF